MRRGVCLGGGAACRGVLTSPDLGAMTWGSALRAVTALLQAKQLRPGLVIARVLGLSQALLRAVASLRPSSLHDFSSMTKKDCHVVVRPLKKL